MTKVISVEDALAGIGEQVLVYAPSGLKKPNWEKVVETSPLFRGGFSFSFEWPGWAMGAEIYVGWEIEVDNKRKNGVIFKPLVTVSWSSSRWSPAQAAALARLHTEVAQFACIIQSYFDALPTIIAMFKKDLPEEK